MGLFLCGRFIMHDRSYSRPGWFHGAALMHCLTLRLHNSFSKMFCRTHIPSRISTSSPFSPSLSLSHRFLFIWPFLHTHLLKHTHIVLSTHTCTYAHILHRQTRMHTSLSQPHTHPHTLPHTHPHTPSVRFAEVHCISPTWLQDELHAALSVLSVLSLFLSPSPSLSLSLPSGLCHCRALTWIHWLLE